MINRFATCFIAALLIVLCAPAGFVWAQETRQIQIRPSNFVFLIDVSGSMLSKKTMVTGADGQQITLFEALRQALQQIVADDRLLSPQSKVAFVTFGTAVTDKSDWPSTLDKPENRQALLSKISSVDDLQADKHGDTYMAGALDRAFQKATELSAQSEPCATCFIVMLTDGWDEPPAAAPLHVRDVAARIVQKQAELRKMLGVNTWQVRVVGLQRLPDRKAGTTTAAEVAKLVGGDFLDVTKQATGTVAQRIYGALEKTINELAGRVEVAKATEGGFADFGTMQGGTKTAASIPVVSRSCYGEKIIGLSDVSSQLSASQKDWVKQQLEALKSARKLKDLPDSAAITLADRLPAQALVVSLDQQLPLVPTIDQVSQGGTVWQPLKISARVGRACPPGTYLGALKFSATARCDSLVPYLITVPSRIVADVDSISQTVRKPGFLWAKPTSTTFKFAVGTSLAGQDLPPQEVIIEPDAAKGEAGTSLERRLINGGKSATIKLNMTQKETQTVTLPVEIPADQKPGKYQGVLHISLPGDNKILAPSAIDYVVDILPSPWEQVSPIAIPILGVLILVVLGWFGVWVASNRS